MKKRTVSILIAALWTFLSGFYFGSALADVPDVLKVGINDDATTVSPFEYKGASDEPINQIMFQQLANYNPVTESWDPELAESFEFLENKADIRVKIRKGSRFSNGDPVTAHDVRFSWQEHTNPKNASVLAGGYAPIKDIEVVDDYTCIFRFARPAAHWRNIMAMTIAPKKYFEKVGAEVYRKMPIGSGAYRLVERKIGEKMTFEAVPNHHKFNPDFKKMELLVVPDMITRVSMLETGELDLIDRIPSHMLKRLKKNKNVSVKVSKVPSWFGMAFRGTTDPLMNDVKLKYAFQHAINRQEIVDKIFLGLGFPHHMFVDWHEWGQDAKVKWEFDPAKARRLVKESSYKPGTELTLSYSLAIPNASLVAISIQHYMKDVGVTVKLQQLEFGTYMTYAMKRDKRMGHMDLFTWPGTIDPIWRMVLGFRSTGFYTPYNNRPNKKLMDQLVDQQAVMIDLPPRLKVLKKIHELDYKDPATVPLFGLKMIYAMNKDIDYTYLTLRHYMDHLYTVKKLK